MNILILNGPNLNLLGTREIEVYGTMTHEELERSLIDYGRSLGVNVEVKQSNLEGILIDILHYAQSMKMDGVLLNAAAFTHYSYALYDAIKAIDVPVYEVHLSDPDTREEAFRHTSVIRPACRKTFKGEGIDSYKKALYTMVETYREQDN
ncbi:MAG: type II 3-dehydroquinate dehydratase [Bacillota bacterium]